MSSPGQEFLKNFENLKFNAFESKGVLLDYLNNL